MHSEKAFDRITSETCKGLYDKIQKKEEEYRIADIESDSMDEDILVPSLLAITIIHGSMNKYFQQQSFRMMGDVR